ncbi:MAG: hypothetical protein HQL79_01120 [Magnetococcales bacterium]|nr:hypothetical protein [Magnetococcales bacterium]
MTISDTFGTIPSTPTPSATTSKSTTQDAATLQADFLKMLTAQLQNQDPLQPMNNTDMTAQMAQFSSLSQQQQSNDLLKQLVSMQSVNQVNQAVGYIGKQVLFNGNTTQSVNGQATVSFNMPQSGNAAINIMNQNGQVVKSLEARPFSAGDQSTTVGGLPDGNYTFAVSIPGSTSTTPVTTYANGEVTGVINDSTSGVTLQVNGQSVKMSDVRSVQLITSSTATPQS